MPLQPQEWAQLEIDTARFATKNHAHYLSEVLQHLKHSQDPQSAIHFVRALGRSSFTDRPQLRSALQDVQGWLEGLLRKQPQIPARELALRIGWARRMSVVRQRSAPRPAQARPR